MSSIINHLCIEEVAAKVIPNIMDENDDVFIDNHNKESIMFVKRIKDDPTKLSPLP